MSYPETKPATDENPDPRQGQQAAQPVAPPPEHIMQFFTYGHLKPDLQEDASIRRLVRWRNGAVMLAGLCWGLMFASFFVTCAHQPAVVVLPDRIGGPAAEAIGVLLGQEPKAATFPDLPTVIFQEEDAGDVCLLAHEGQHRADMAAMGPARWTAVYIYDYGACVKDRPSAECLKTIPLEARAYAVQHACQKAQEQQ